MPLAPILLPLAMAVVTFYTPSKRWRPRLLAGTAVAHFALTLGALASPVAAGAGEWLRLDAPGRLLLALVSVLFLCCAVYSVGYLRYRVERANRRFTACLLVVLGTMSLVAFAQHLGLLWIGMEATTLATAPLIYFNRTPRSIEATWKYLVLSSVGIALALFGSFFLGYAALSGGGEASLLFPDLLAGAGSLSRPWLRAGFTLLLVGYGTKLGLAPMHTWKPDAYGEAPPTLTALVSSALFGVAMYAIMRWKAVADATLAGHFTDNLLMVLGMLSLAIAAFSVVLATNYKRMLAYSSIEHTGLVCLGLALGPLGAFAALLHLVNHTLAKSLMFFLVDNIESRFPSPLIAHTRGLAKALPWTGALFAAGLLILLGLPPGAMFVSEYSILRAGFVAGRPWLMAATLALLAIVFVSFIHHLQRLLYGAPPASVADFGELSRAVGERFTWRIGLLLPGLIVLLALGLTLPGPLQALLAASARLVAR